MRTDAIVRAPRNSGDVRRSGIIPPQSHPERVLPPAAVPESRAERRNWWWLLAVAVAVLGVGYGLREPWPADEPRFVLVARQMLDSGDFLFPHRGQELYPDKPPLYFWLLAGARVLVGSFRWSFLLPSLLAALGTLALVRDLGRRLWTPQAGTWAAIAVLCTFQFVYQAKRAQIDPTLVLFTTLSFYGLMRHVLLGPHWRWFWFGCFAAGLGVIAKGVGFLPLLALAPFAAMRWRGWDGLSPPSAQRGDSWRWLGGALAFLAAIALWLGPMAWSALAGGDPEHRAYLDNLLFKQTADRYTDPWQHKQPAWYFLQAIAVYWLPFSLALPWLARHWAAAWRARDARVWLPLAWAVLVVVFFSLSPGKRDMYILPALPAVALAAAPFAQAVWERRGFRLTAWWFALAFGVVVLALGAAALSGRVAAVDSFAAMRGLGTEVRALWWMLAAVGAIALVAALVARPRRVGWALALALGAAWGGYGLVGYPVLDPSSSSRALMTQARTLAGPHTEIGLVDWKEQNLLQAVGPTAEFGFRAPRKVQLQRGVDWLRAAPGRRLLVPGAVPGECVQLDAAHATRVGVANRRTWWLAGPEAIVGACR
jgi:4-amino-4-deoxy-L-arabinose transferase-like glycosyltransferase